MKRNLTTKLLGLLLAVCLTVSCCLTSAFAVTANAATDPGSLLTKQGTAYAQRLTDALGETFTGDVQADLQVLLTEGKLYNFLVVGVDSRSNDYEGRSDAMLELTVNPVERKLVLTSLLRDSYVTIPGNGQDRLNAAYALGGTSLLKKTIRQNYGIRTNATMVVNFNDVIDFIDAIGGIPMTVTASEIKYINKYTADQNKELYGRSTNPDRITSGAGTLTLSGMQALAYARIRYVGQDFGRTERQRKVVAAAMKKLLSLPVNEQVPIIAEYFGRVTTDLTVPELLYLVLVFLNSDRFETASLSLPAAGTYQNARIDGKDVLKVDFAANKAVWSAAVGA